MNSWQIIALIAGGSLTILKGDKIWDFFKHVFDNSRIKKENEELRAENMSLKKKLKSSESSNTRLKKLLK